MCRPTDTSLPCSAGGMGGPLKCGRGTRCGGVAPTLHTHQPAAHLRHRERQPHDLPQVRVGLLWEHNDGKLLWSTQPRHQQACSWLRCGRMGTGSSSGTRGLTLHPSQPHLPQDHHPHLVHWHAVQRPAGRQWGNASERAAHRYNRGWPLPLQVPSTPPPPIPRAPSNPNHALQGPHWKMLCLSGSTREPPPHSACTKASRSA